MAEDPLHQADQAQKFHTCASKLMSLVLDNEESFKQELDRLLDELNALEYPLCRIGKEEVERLLCHGTRHVHHSNELLVTKFSQLIVNVVGKQQITPGVECLDALLEYLIGALRKCQTSCFPNVLMAMGATLYESNHRMEEYWDCLAGPEGMLVKMASPATSDLEVRRSALKCLENFSIRCPGEPYIGELYSETCFQVFLLALRQPKQVDMDEQTYCRMMISALRGLQNLIINSKNVHTKRLGELLAVLKALMVYGMPGPAVQVPRSLYPTPLSQYDVLVELSVTKGEEKAVTKPLKSNNSSKKTKKKRAPPKSDVRGWQTEQNAVSGDSPVDPVIEVGGGGESYFDPLSSIWTPSRSPGSSVRNSSPSFHASWGKASSSDSECSDTEGGQMMKLRLFQSKVRSCAHSVLLATVKGTERRTMFGYLSAFLPDAPAIASGPQTQTLLTSILKDPSSKVRAVALSVLTAMLDGSKQYLALADDSEKHHAAFTSFSKTLASMIKELHRCLLFSLVAETSPLILTQLIKCLSTLIINVPYHKLAPGLLTKLVKHLRSFLNHRDSNVRVACLTSLGSLISIQPSLPEVSQILLEETATASSSPSISLAPMDDLGRQLGVQSLDIIKPTLREPSPAGGLDIALPTSVDMQVAFGAMIGSAGSSRSESWLVYVCRENVFQPVKGFSDDMVARTVPLPVRLESLQVLSALARGYFFVLRSSIHQIASVIHACLLDPEPAVGLHGARLFEQIGSAMTQELAYTLPPQGPLYPLGYEPMTVEETVCVWLHLLDGPLPSVIQNLSHPALRATGCDCLANIGARPFELLPMDYRVLCVNLLLTLVADEDNNTKAEAVRALGVYVLFPNLRENICFLADAANAIITAMEDANVNVRIKACWALGNLSDAFVLNRTEGNDLFVEELSDRLLHKLCEIAVAAALDNDKVKSNAVRAIGNLLRFMGEKTVSKGNFTEVIHLAIQALVRNISTGNNMKVRWNACYAVGNVFRNPVIPFYKAEWLTEVFFTLTCAIQTCKNFKVRINAALALIVPTKREVYGTSDQFARIWDELAIGLDTGQHATDFSDYNYRDNLLDQLCCTLCHLASLLVADDLPSLTEVLTVRQSQLAACMEKFRERLDLEKEDLLKTAHHHISLLISEGDQELDNGGKVLLRELFALPVPVSND